jgi:hypothetical protein
MTGIITGLVIAFIFFVLAAYNMWSATTEDIIEGWFLKRHITCMVGSASGMFITLISTICALYNYFSSH